MKIQWEYDLVEKPFRDQLRAMGWQWLEGDTDVPELTERGSFREVLLLVRDLDRAGICPAGKERDLAQRLVTLARENHENLTQP